MDGLRKDLNQVLLSRMDYQVYLSSMDFRSMSVRQENMFFLCYFALLSLLLWMQKCNDVNNQEVQGTIISIITIVEERENQRKTESRNFHPLSFEMKDV